MDEALPAETSPFPAPVRLDGYFAWTWRLFRACFWRLVLVFAAAAAGAWLVFVGLGFINLYILDATLEFVAVTVALQQLLSAVFGSVAVAIAAPVFIHELTGKKVGAHAGRRSLKPMLGHVLVAGLYVAMPLLLVVLFLGPITQLFLLPALLGPPIVVHAIVWEQKGFRDASTRAKNLLAGNWAQVLSALLLVALGAGVLHRIGLTLVGEFVIDGQASDAAGWLSAWLVLTLLSALAWLLSAAAGTVAYLDLRARFEELGPDSLAAEVAEISGTEPPSPD